MAESIFVKWTQVVSISGCMSETVHITSVVPQGSVLGPTLFLLFINDIDDILFDTSVHLKLFADDVRLYVVLLFKDHLVTFKW